MLLFLYQMFNAFALLLDDALLNVLLQKSSRFQYYCCFEDTYTP